jgi:hypothetical protein
MGAVSAAKAAPAPDGVVNGTSATDPALVGE